MKKTNIFWGNQHVDSMYVGKTKWQVTKYKAGVFMKRTLLAMGFLSAIGWSAYGGAFYSPRVVNAEKIVEVPAKAEIPPVMQRIMDCESSRNHKNPKNGQINYHVNSDGTIDLGLMEINTVNFPLATKMGYDLTKEEDNVAFAMYLYSVRGTEPWFSSKSCWNK